MSETCELPIETQLQGDQAGEGVEYFTICLPEQSLQLMGAEAVAPTCARVTIIDDDCKNLYIYIDYYYISSATSHLQWHQLL